MISLDRDVVLTSLERAAYTRGPRQQIVAPELPAHAPRTPAVAALRALWRMAELDLGRFGSSRWNPLSEIVRPGDRILIKPNWVLHQNRGAGGLESLVTHVSLIEALTNYVAKAQPSRIVIGDAPLQGCDFESLQSQIRMDRVLERLTRNFPGCPISVRDLRFTVRVEHGLIPKQISAARPRDAALQFDLGANSALEPISGPDTAFRVTMYNPELLARAHGGGRHRYAIAREAIDADVVFNVPKLKTHKKAGITGALKNLIGINCHKEFLPHHRQGSPADGGDCYAHPSLVSHAADKALDTVYSRDLPLARYLVERTLAVYEKVLRIGGHTLNLEGAWHGNDTIWRTCHDLIRIIHNGRADGTLANEAQRRVITVTDGIIAGDGDGPLRPHPVPLGVVTMGGSEPALDWVHSLLMGFDPSRIPIVGQAFADTPFRLSNVPPSAISVVTPAGRISPAQAGACYGRPFQAPVGWRGHCELVGAECEQPRSA